MSQLPDAPERSPWNAFRACVMSGAAAERNASKKPCRAVPTQQGSCSSSTLHAHAKEAVASRYHAPFRPIISRSSNLNASLGGNDDSPHPVYRLGLHITKPFAVAYNTLHDPYQWMTCCFRPMLCLTSGGSLKVAHHVTSMV